ncbi:MAG TPA: hypothetical protein VFA09_08060 [Ktedonobacteraceae bacterium]|jgi:predicted nucleic acid-binding protein|nr:hypothetical protein [Ktedonobacteraceae bacterium]
MGDVFKQDCIILDACCVINLYASGEMESILKAVSKSVAIAAYVRDHEALRIISEVDSATTQKYEQINLQPFIDSGLLIVVTPESEAENTSFVNFAAALDDGEAITCAIAFHRNWSIASDDRKATNFFNQHAPHLQVLSTPELIKYWIDTTNPPGEVIRLALQRIRIKAKYEPPLRHKLYLWWQKLKDGKTL